MTSLKEWESLLSPATQRNLERRRRVLDIQFRLYQRLFPWMKHPFLHYITSFWVGLIDEGPYQMLKPRWGGITFGWLNDGMKPTVWHTVWGLFHSEPDPYCGIYPSGAPASLKEAREKEVAWAIERLEGQGFKVLDRDHDRLLAEVIQKESK